MSESKQQQTQPNHEGKSRRHFTAEQKAQIVRRHLADKVPVSNLADELGIQPSQIYLWVKQVLDQAERAFLVQPGGKRRRHADDPKDRKIARLEAAVAQKDAKLAQKNEVIAELMEDNVRSKKAAGEL